MGSFPRSATWPAKCAIATSINRCLSGRGKQVYEQVEEHLAYLAANPDAADRHERVRALVECPQPLVSLFSGRFAAADPALRKLMLEVLTWRYYRIRTLTNFRSVAVDGQCCVSAEYDHEGKRIHVFATHAEYSRLAEAARALFPLIAEVPADHDIVIDFYAFAFRQVWAIRRLRSRKFTPMLNQARLPALDPAHRSGSRRPGRGQGMAGMQHFTYRPSGECVSKRRSSTAESIP